ncbi:MULTISPECIES: metal ABC transporter solute-binding protein, Zn/Mn family [Vitreoscilla]|uniref:Zinc ABC transporter substrate-binding protein n=1 Tax=Vitreoscilla stercoraria TaxID=61 RepID=A0ABY4E900_VITST|nr:MULTISPECIES: zinc ABC transporter substrate-binding protein [Vitreoscilla]UOO91806.1 zinc ABC transporter substrate-binding protein [Vitreoscilla stercoraria]
MLAFMPVMVWAQKPIAIVTSFSILQDITQQLGGNRVQVTTLISPNTDAHTYQLRAQDMQKIQAAQLIVLNGLSFERADIRRATQNSGKKIVHAAAGLPALPMAEHEHHASHEHGAFDPHVWHDPILMQTYSRNISQALIQIDPQSKAYYQQRLQQYQSQLQQLHTWAAQQFQNIPQAQRKALTAHESFAYLGKRYHIHFYAPQGISTHDAASAASVAALIQQIKRDKIKAVFVENMVNPKLVQQIAKETHTRQSGVLYADALSQQAPANTYLGLMRHNIQALANAMR